MDSPEPRSPSKLLRRRSSRRWSLDKEDISDAVAAATAAAAAMDGGGSVGSSTSASFQSQQRRRRSRRESMYNNGEAGSPSSPTKSPSRRGSLASQHSVHSAIERRNSAWEIVAGIASPKTPTGEGGHARKEPMSGGSLGGGGSFVMGVSTGGSVAQQLFMGAGLGGLSVDGNGSVAGGDRSVAGDRSVRFADQANIFDDEPMSAVSLPRLTKDHDAAAPTEDDTTMPMPQEPPSPAKKTKDELEKDDDDDDDDDSVQSLDSVKSRVSVRMISERFEGADMQSADQDAMAMNAFTSFLAHNELESEDLRDLVIAPKNGEQEYSYRELRDEC